MRVNYKAKNSYTYIPSLNEPTPTFSNSNVVGIVAGIFAGLLVLIIGVNILSKK